MDAPIVDALFADATVGACLVDAQGGVLRANDAWRAASEDVQRRARRIPVPFEGGVGALLIASETKAPEADEATERKRAQAALSAATEELRAIIDASPIAKMALDREGRLILWSREAERLFGWKAAEVLGRRPPVIPEDKQEELAALRRLTTRGAVLNTVRLARDGRRIPVNVFTSPLRDENGAIKGIVASFVDLTESNALREALVDSERRFAAAFEAGPTAKVIVRTDDRRVMEVNSEYLALAGLTRDEALARAVHELPLGPIDAEHESVWRALAEGENVHGVALAFVRPDGSQGDAEASFERMPLYGESYVLMEIQDVTVRRRAERALQESEERFRQLADTIQEVFWLSDIDKASIAYISPAYETVWGRSRDALYRDARDWVAAIHPDDRDRVLAAALTKQSAGTYDEEYRVVRPDGSVRWIRDRAFPVRDASGRVFRIAGSAQDITDRRSLEEQLRQTQKLESIGLLAGGIAHDFNNLLTVFFSGCDALVELGASDETERAEIVCELREAAERASTLTRQLLTFSRREVVSPRVIDLGGAVTDTERMLRRVLGEDVLLSVSLGREPAMVEIDPSSLTQVLVNLAVNARDAMPRGGRLTIKTRRVVVGDEPRATGSRIPPGTYVALAMRDTGVGMTPEVRSRIFEPFFTTKGAGRGTGLGLAVVHGIVAQAGGHLDVESTPGSGTTFTVYLPAALGSERPRSVRADAEIPRVQGTETILVVEDEDSIRRFVCRALAQRGYQVLEGRNGVDALATARAHTGPIHLLMTDVVMPLMDGRILAETLGAQRPEMRVLFTSGHGDDAIGRYGVDRPEVALLQKPYEVAQLRQKVREVLGSAASDRAGTGT